MVQSLSAKKRIRQNVKRRARNRWRKSQIKQAVKQFDEALHAGDTDKAAEQLKLCYKRLDQVAAKGAIHKNAAARQKARLAKRLDEAASK
ncbi:MAG: 30S ribosomal protein S20 [Phycisphaerae bacterium]|nr:30S ribosomal protein S20 [Phycisphaerae bacterium]